MTTKHLRLATALALLLGLAACASGPKTVTFKLPDDVESVDLFINGELVGTFSEPTAFPIQIDDDPSARVFVQARTETHRSFFNTYVRDALPDEILLKMTLVY